MRRSGRAGVIDEKIEINIGENRHSMDSSDQGKRDPGLNKASFLQLCLLSDGLEYLRARASMSPGFLYFSSGSLVVRLKILPWY